MMRSGSPSSRGRRYASQRSEEESHQCRSSIASSVGWRSAQFAVSQKRPWSIASDDCSIWLDEQTGRVEDRRRELGRTGE